MSHWVHRGLMGRMQRGGEGGEGGEGGDGVGRVVEGDTLDWMAEKILSMYGAGIEQAWSRHKQQ